MGVNQENKVVRSKFPDRHLHWIVTSQAAEPIVYRRLWTIFRDHRSTDDNFSEAF